MASPCSLRWRSPVRTFTIPLWDASRYGNPHPLFSTTVILAQREINVRVSTAQPSRSILKDQMKPTTTVAHEISSAKNRQSPRHEARHFIVIEYRNRRVNGLCVDYSDGGFGAIIQHELPVGEIICVELPAAGHQHTRLMARAVYRKKTRYGFEFVAPAGSQRQAIADFFREALERSGPSETEERQIEPASFLGGLATVVDRHLNR